MKVLWAARSARFDLLRQVAHLACYVSRLGPLQDKALHRLIGYIAGSQDLRLVGWVGDPLSVVRPHLFADADFAGDVETQRSTN